MWGLLQKFWSWLTSRDAIDTAVRENFATVTSGWKEMTDRMSGEIDRLQETVTRLDDELEKARAESEACHREREIDRVRMSQLEQRLAELEAEQC